MARKKKVEEPIEELEEEYDDGRMTDPEEIKATIRELAGEGNTMEDISDVLGYDANRLFSNPSYKREYELGMADMRVSLRHWQFQSAKSGNTPMLVWLGKVILGQKEETVTAVRFDREDDELSKSLLNLAKEMDKSNGK